MSIQKVINHQKSQSNLNRLFLLFFLLFISVLNAQTENKHHRKIIKIGILFSSAKQNNVLFNDRDYDYLTNTFKTQFFYLLKKGNKWDINLLFQPQIQHVSHQLLNEQFITPEITDYEYLRERFSKKKSLSLFAFEIGVQFKKEIIKKISFEAMIGLGAGYIDVKTERLAHGFTFIENLTLGFVYTNKKSDFYIGSTFGHVSNLNFELPNSGFNLFGIEFGVRYHLNKHKKEL